MIWLVQYQCSGVSIAEHAIALLTPFGMLNGVILLAYIVAMPATEIVIPTVLMLTVLSLGTAGAGEGAGVLHNPCSTTIYTIY